MTNDTLPQDDEADEDPPLARGIGKGRSRQAADREQAGLDPGLVGSLFAFRLRAARLAIRRDLDRRLAPVKLTPIQFALLELVRCNAGARPAELADTLFLDRSTVNQALAQLGRKGLVVRRAREDDPRSQGAWLTPAGSVLLEGATERVRQQDRVLAEVLSREQRATLEALLERISHGRFRPRPGSRS